MPQWIQNIIGSYDEAAQLVTSEVGGALGTIFDWGSAAFLETLNFLFNLLPTGGGLPEQTFTSAQVLGSKLSLLNVFVPVDTIITMLSIMISIQFVIMSYKLGMRLYSFGRGIEYKSDPALDVSNPDTNTQSWGGVQTNRYIKDKYNIPR